MGGAILVFRKMPPAATDLILITLGSNRMVRTAIPSGASDLNCTVSCCFSPTRSSPFSETRRNSETLASLALTRASLLGDSCSTTSAVGASVFALAEEAVIPVPGETIFLIALATSSVFGSPVNAAPFGAGAVETFCAALISRLGVATCWLAVARGNSFGCRLATLLCDTGVAGTGAAELPELSLVLFSIAAVCSAILGGGM